MSPLIPHAYRIRLRAERWQALGLFPELRIGAWLKQVLGAHGGETAALWWPVWTRSAQTRVAAGAEFEFGLLGLPAAVETLQRVLAGVRAVHTRDFPPVPFGQGLRCVAVAPLDAAHAPADRLTGWVETLTQALLEAPVWCWRWLSPARLRARGVPRGSGEARFIHAEAGLDGTRLAELVTDTLDALALASGLPRALPVLPPLPLIASELYWLDLHYQDPAGRAKPCGGLLGELLIRRPEGLTAAQAQTYALASVLGIGQRRAFGLGQFALLPSAPGEWRRPAPQALPSLLQTLGTPEHLRAARWRRPSPQEADWGDPPLQPAPEADGTPLSGWLQRAADTWARGELVSPRPLHPVQIPRPDGRIRELRIPPLGDRILQRVLLDALAPTVDTLFSERSYGFRPGRSRLQARDRLLALYEQGRRVVAESDVAGFFDAVEHRRVAIRLRGLLGDDPVVAQVLAYIAAPEQAADGSRVERPRGLPQGAPLSPWLSNLLLDDLDHDLALAGFEAVRYADDFVIATRNTAEAEAALHLAAQSLAEKGLSLKGAKSRITTFEAGFTFLGYQFVGGLAVDQRGPAPPIPADSALQEDLAAHVPEPIERFQPDPELSPADPGGTLLVVSRAQATLSATGGQLHARWPEGDGAAWPLATLGAVVLISRQRLTSHALQALLAAEVPIHVADGRGHWLGATTPWPRPLDVELWGRQQRRFSEAAFALGLAQATVIARIRHQAEVLRRRLDPNAPELTQLDARAAAVPAATTLDTVRGHEGWASRLYFQTLARLLPAEWGFIGRERRPPTDPYNALLSLGAVILHSRVDLALRALGLLPTCGYLHGGRGRHAALASDLMEPVRHRVERTAFGLLRRRMLRPEHFSTEANGACRLTPAAKRLYFTALETEFAAPSLLLGADTPGTLMDHLRLQAFSLIAAIDGISAFQPIRYR